MSLLCRHQIELKKPRANLTGATAVECPVEFLAAWSPQHIITEHQHDINVGTLRPLLRGFAMGQHNPLAPVSATLRKLQNQQVFWPTPQQQVQPHSATTEGQRRRKRAGKKLVKWQVQDPAHQPRYQEATPRWWSKLYLGHSIFVEQCAIKHYRCSSV